MRIHFTQKSGEYFQFFFPRIKSLVIYRDGRHGNNESFRQVFQVILVLCILLPFLGVFL